MSISDWSDLETNLNEIEEDASVRIVKSSTVSHLVKQLQISDPSEHSSLYKPVQPFSLSTSYNPQRPQKTPKSPVKFKINTRIVDIFDDIKITPTKANDITERCYKFKEKVKAKIDKLTKDQEELHKKFCPFKPQLLGNNKKTKRKFQEFLKDVKKIDRNKEQKISDLKMRKEKEGEIMKPIGICKNTEKILKKKSCGLGVYQKLYVERRVLKKTEKKFEILSFSPTVNPKSHDLKRDQSIEQILYNDAMRRNTKRSQSPLYIKEKFISSKSEQVLTEKFIKEFGRTLDFLYPKDKNDFAYSEFVTILCELNFIHNDIDDKYYYFERELGVKAWEKVRAIGIGKGSRVSILAFLLCVMNYEHSSADDEIKTIHREFISFYECRHWFVVNDKRRREKREMTFTPSQFSGYSISPCEVTRRSLYKNLEMSLALEENAKSRLGNLTEKTEKNLPKPLNHL